MTDTGFHQQPHLTETEARQAFRGRHIFWVMTISTTLAIIALAAVWGYHARDLAAVDAGRAHREAAAVQTMNNSPPPPAKPAQGG